MSSQTYAQQAFTGSVTTSESPSLKLEDNSDALWQQRIDRSEGFRAKMLSTHHGLNLFAEYKKAYMRNRIEHSVDCRLAQRKSNKEGLFSVSARCYRTSLLMEREFWQKHSQQIESIPGVSNKIRGKAISAITEMIDAIDAIILGIDSSVYKSLDGLLEAKQNLHKKYRAPVSLSISHVRADRTLSWIAHFMTSMLSIIETEDISEETFSELMKASYCLEMGELFMKEILIQEDNSQASLILSQSLVHLQSCEQYFKQAYDSNQKLDI
jgi:hypothetical protein